MADEELTETSSGAASHDQPVADAFARFMSTGWAAPTGALPRREAIAEHTVRRRQLLADQFPGKTLVVPTGQLKARANDTDYAFRPGSDFFWLTGCHEPEAVLVMTNGNATLYLAGRSDRSTSAFYRDRRYGELWVGPRLGIAETQARLGIECVDIAELQGVIDPLDTADTLIVRGFDPSIDTRFPETKEHVSLARTLSDLRLIKDEYEIAQLRSAIAATAGGFEQSVREFDTAATQHRGERWLEGTFWRQARTQGNDVGYVSIVACGHHATTLHWVTNDGPVARGDMALLDMGVEGSEYYTADVTRTLPINGTYSPPQREVYEAVHAAHQAALQAVRPGAHFLDPHRAAMEVLAHQLEAWGILPVPAAEALTPESGVYRRYTLHSVSHMLGLDVHDCANASTDKYYDGKLEPGMVLTIEPGLYFQQDDETVPERFRGLGVRIEDDVLVTESGHEVLSAALPVEASAVEAWMKSLISPTL